MKFLDKLKSIKFYAKRLKLNTVAIIAAFGLIAAVPVAMGVVAEYYPSRTPYDYNKPCNPNDSDKYDRCGSLEGPVFNSFINTPSYGDERAFLDARRSDQTASGSYKNVLDDVTDGSKEVVVRMYIHNNANESTNASGLGVAKNTKVRVSVPTAAGNSLRARGYISADNAALVEDTVDFVDDKKFKVEFIPGSARLFDNDNFKNGVKLSNSIVTTGATIGSDSLNGELKGCFEYEAIVQVRLKVTPQTPDTKFTKRVATTGSTAWGEQVNVKPGDKVSWLVNFSNEGNTDLTKVNINDKLPPHLRVTPGSVKWTYRDVNGTDKTAVQDDKQFFTTGGIDFGKWSPNGGFYVRFDTTALGDFEGCEVLMRNVARLKTAQTSQIEDTADVKITKENCDEPKPKVSFSCVSLVGNKLSRTSYIFTITGRATNTKITGYKFTAIGPLGNNSRTRTFTSNGENANSAVFTAPEPGDYKITGQVITAAGTTKVTEACTERITIENEPSVPTYSCDLLEKKKLSDREYQLTTTASAAGGATIKQYTYDFGDGSDKLLTDKASVKHTYPKNGKFVTTVTVEYSINGKSATKTSEKCKVLIDTNTPTKPTPTNGKLPNTGPAETAGGLFSAVSIAGGVAHRFFTKRRG
jgi:uncharacterized repeat protein (TIGR01451 family)